MFGQMRHALLTVDAVVNLVLGGCLLAIPGATIRFFGLPVPATYFYVTVLGAVLVGIGIALWLERLGDPNMRGLGLAGAIAINVLGAGTVVVWLLLDPFRIPAHGYVVLWAVALVVLGVALAEAAALALPRGGDEAER